MGVGKHVTEKVGEEVPHLRETVNHYVFRATVPPP